MAVPPVANKPFCRCAAALVLPLGVATEVVGADVSAIGDAAGDAASGSVVLLPALYSKVDKHGKKGYGTALKSKNNEGFSLHSTFLP